MPRKSPLNQCHGRALHRDIGTGAHRNADLRLRQSRRVIDPVSGHRDDPALLLEVSHRRGLLIRKDLGGDVVKAELATDSLCCSPAVAGQHDNAHPIPAQRPQRAARALLDRIGDRDEPGRDAVDRNQYDALAVFPKVFRAWGQARRLDAEGCEQSQIADGDLPSVDDPDDAFPHLGPEVPHCAERQTAFLGAAHDGGRQRVLTAPLEASGQAQ